MSRQRNEKRKVRWSPQAAEELAIRFDYWQKQAPRTGARLLRELETTLELLTEFPGLGSRVGAASLELRQVLADELRVVYRLRGEEAIVIVSVRHASERPLSPDELIKFLDNGKESTDA